MWDEKNRENLCKENNYMTQDICGSAMCLCLQSCSNLTMLGKITETVTIWFFNTTNPNKKWKINIPNNGAKNRAKIYHMV